MNIFSDYQMTAAHQRSALSKMPRSTSGCASGDPVQHFSIEADTRYAQNTSLHVNERKCMHTYFSYLKYHIHLYMFLRKSLPGLSLQRPTATNVVASLKQGDLDEFDAGTRPKSQSSRSSASPRPLTSRASTTKLKVTFFCQIFTPLIMKMTCLHKRIIII